jgi:hypothetical protein
VTTTPNPGPSEAAALISICLRLAALSPISRIARLIGIPPHDDSDAMGEHLEFGFAA